MGDILNGREVSLRREQEALRANADSYGMGETSTDRERVGCESLGTSGTIRQRDDRARFKPVTHGKTLSFLIKLLADQVAESEEISRREEVKRQQLHEQIEELQATLLEWKERVNQMDVEQE